jgi:hypothetical protein
MGSHDHVLYLAFLPFVTVITAIRINNRATLIDIINRNITSHFELMLSYFHTKQMSLSNALHTNRAANSLLKC